MSKTRVINIRSGECYDADGNWREGYVYIGRHNRAWNLDYSIWANPFKLSQNKDNPQICLDKFRALAEVLLTDEKQKDFWLEKLRELQGQTLVCWCKPKPCHGDVLVELIEKYFPSEGDDK